MVSALQIEYALINIRVHSCSFLLFHPISGIIQPTQFHHPELQPLRRSEGQGLFVVSACEQAFHCAPSNNMFAINMTPPWQQRREVKPVIKKRSLERPNSEALSLRLTVTMTVTMTNFPASTKWGNRRSTDSQPIAETRHWHCCALPPNRDIHHRFIGFKLALPTSL